jgi:ABC-type phosphate/phosphonate transport system substrate-binding protein
MKLWRICLALALSCFSAGVVLADLPPPIAIGFYNQVIRDIPRKDVEVSLRFWTDELAASVNVPFKPIRFYDSMHDMRRALNSGEINFIVASSMGVAQTFPNEELRDGFAGLRNQSDHLLLAVRKASGIQRLTDLAGKRLALLSSDELSEVYLETLLMKAWGKPDETRLGEVHREKRSNTLVHDLFFGRADVALVKRNTFDSAVALNPQVAQQVIVLEDFTFKGRSPHIGLFSSKVAPEHAAAITAAVMRLGQTARGRQVLEIYNSDVMVPTKVQDLDPFRELLSQHRALLAVAGAMPKKGAR